MSVLKKPIKARIAGQVHFGVPSTGEYIQLMGIPPDAMSTEQRMRFELGERVMLSRNVINVLAKRMHDAKLNQLAREELANPEEFKSKNKLRKIILPEFEADVHDVINTLRKPGKQGSPEEISKLFLQRGYVGKNRDGKIERMFVFNPSFDTPDLKVDDLRKKVTYGPRQAVGVMTSFLSSYSGCQEKLVAEAIALLKRRYPDSFLNKRPNDATK